MSQPTKPDTAQPAVGTISATVEEGQIQRVRCEIRDGEAFFIYWLDGSPRQTVMHADDHIALLEDLREHATQRQMPRLKFRGEVSH